MYSGANPAVGSDIRKPGSTACVCGSWHRPGSICPNTKKSAVGTSPTTINPNVVMDDSSPQPNFNFSRDDLVNESNHFQSTEDKYNIRLLNWLQRYASAK